MFGNMFNDIDVVRFDKAGSAEVRLDRNTSNRPVVRSNFNVIKKRINGRI